MRIVRLPLGDVPAAQAVVNDMLSRVAEKHPVLVELRRDVFYGGVVWVVQGDNGPLSIHCTKLGKRRKNVWEPYANFYMAYTRPEYRRGGLATALYRAMETIALAQGCRRVKSLAGSRAGLALHRALGHKCWGLTPNNEVFVDSPLPGHEAMYSDKIPPPQAPGPLMRPKELSELIKKGLRYDQKA